MNTNWHELKENIYFEDGSFRDIYVFDINLEEWKKWVNFVNQNYEIEFAYGETEQRTSSIDFSAVKKFWNGKMSSEIVRLSKLVDLISIVISLRQMNLKMIFYPKNLSL